MDLTTMCLFWGPQSRQNSARLPRKRPEAMFLIFSVLALEP